MALPLNSLLMTYRLKQAFKRITITVLLAVAIIFGSTSGVMADVQPTSCNFNLPPDYLQSIRSYNTSSSRGINFNSGDYKSFAYLTSNGLYALYILPAQVNVHIYDNTITMVNSGSSISGGQGAVFFLASNDASWNSNNSNSLFFSAGETKEYIP